MKSFQAPAAFFLFLWFQMKITQRERAKLKMQMATLELLLILYKKSKIVTRKCKFLIYSIVEWLIGKALRMEVIYYCYRSNKKSNFYYILGKSNFSTFNSIRGSHINCRNLWLENQLKIRWQALRRRMARKCQDWWITDDPELSIPST